MLVKRRAPHHAPVVRADELNLEMVFVLKIEEREPVKGVVFPCHVGWKGVDGCEAFDVPRCAVDDWNEMGSMDMKRSTG